MTYGLTAGHVAMLRFVTGFQAAHGFSPSYREIRKGCGLLSLSLVQDRLRALEARGYIRRLRNRARAIEVLQPPSIPRAPDGAPLHFVALAQ